MQQTTHLDSPSSERTPSRQVVFISWASSRACCSRLESTIQTWPTCKREIIQLWSESNNRFPLPNYSLGGPPKGRILAPETDREYILICWVRAPQHNVEKHELTSTRQRRPTSTPRNQPHPQLVPYSPQTNPCRPQEKHPPYIPRAPEKARRRGQGSRSHEPIIPATSNLVSGGRVEPTAARCELNNGSFALGSGAPPRLCPHPWFPTRILLPHHTPHPSQGPPFGLIYRRGTGLWPKGVNVERLEFGLVGGFV